MYIVSFKSFVKLVQPDMYLKIVVLVVLILRKEIAPYFMNLSTAILWSFRLIKNRKVLVHFQDYLVNKINKSTKE